MMYPKGTKKNLKQLEKTRDLQPGWISHFSSPRPPPLFLWQPSQTWFSLLLPPENGQNGPKSFFFLHILISRGRGRGWFLRFPPFPIPPRDSDGVRRTLQARNKREEKRENGLESRLLSLLHRNRSSSSSVRWGKPTLLTGEESWY